MLAGDPGRRPTRMKEPLLSREGEVHLSVYLPDQKFPRGGKNPKVSL